MRIRKWGTNLFVNVPTEPKARQAIRKVSPKQRARMRLLAELKLEWVKAQIEEFGYVTCQGACQRRIYDAESAVRLLDGHHIIKRSLGGKDVPENLLYLCRRDHDAVPPTKRGERNGL